MEQNHQQFNAMLIQQHLDNIYFTLTNHRVTARSNADNRNTVLKGYKKIMSLVNKFTA